MCCNKSKPLNKLKIRYLIVTLFIFLQSSNLDVLNTNGYQGTSLISKLNPLSLFISKSYANGQDKIKKREKPFHSYTVQQGDNLSEIFIRLGFKYSVLMKIIEADSDFLRIDTIKPGHILHFWVKNDTLTKFEVEFNIATKVEFVRKKNGYYQAKEINIPGDWERTVMLGKIRGNFFNSAKDAGLTFNEHQAITQILKDKINFSRDLRPGDDFEVISNVHFVGDKLSGQSEILAVRFRLGKKKFSAFLHNDGNYYDENGESLQSNTFLPYPLEKKVRISSHFNPSRLHPVTGRISPHNGTDFAVDIGTPIIATADGVVSLVRDHPYAGHYLVIDHGTQYQTRYLHNSKILVKKGDKIKKGDRIALSGNSGRVSGAHLHYEILLKGRAIDATKSNIPMSTTVPQKELKSFKKMVKDFSNMLKRDVIAKL